MRYMLDTNICIHLIQNHPPQVIARFQQVSVGEVVMSVVTHAELSHGVERCTGADHAQAATSLRQLIRLVPVLPLDTDASAQYGVLAAIRDRRRDALDRLIAAHAIAAGAVLVTNNEDDFRDYPGLQLENWVAAEDET
ncbi:PIN domain-containing protein [Thauera aromatica]|uniref:Ribonuclease VapC n=1 Tax=Thauera aromatica K172 TaxID=44139 RepID=A0A2R4BNT7_THAAR|nr:PIN domain-containing protein [Thauera aromatica]AVR88950.1 VapC toxin protein [Thauera aromatica K172]